MVSRCPQRGRELGCLEGVGEAGGSTVTGLNSFEFARDREINVARRPPSTVSTQDGHGPAGVPQQAPRFRTIQVCPKDFPAMPRQSSGAAPATFVGGLTMSEVVDEGQSWASDIIGVLSGVGLYSVLIFLVTFLCLYVPA